MTYFFITGASKGIGRALAELLLSEEEVRVVGISRHATIAHEHYRHVGLDFSDLVAVANSLGNVFTELPDATRLVLVNNAAVLGEIGYVGEQTDAHFQFVMNVNVVSPAMLMNSFLKTYQQRSARKTVLNISSGAGKHPIDGWASYCASKAALDMLSQVAAREQEVRGSGTRIFSLSPGVVDTEMQAQIRAADPGQFSSVQRFKDYHQKRELQDPKEVARKIKHLLDNETEFPNVLVSLPR